MMRNNMKKTMNKNDKENATQNSWIILLLALAPLAAQAEDYIISKGDHYSNPMSIQPYITRSAMKFKVMFNDSAKYDFVEVNKDKNPTAAEIAKYKEDQWDVNKLYGITDCGSWTATKNSARFGWAWNNITNKLDIYAFTHKDGKFDFLMIDTAELNQVHDMEIGLSADHSKYEYKFKGKTVSMARGCSDSDMSGYRLKPYFGGDQVAPHDVLIKIEDADDYATASIQNVYPNPTSGENLWMDLNLPESVELGFRLYDFIGRLVHEIEPQSLEANPALKGHQIRINSLPVGEYLIRPFVLKNGELIPGFVHGEGRAKKIIVVQ
jgi:hypothetical protein